MSQNDKPNLPTGNPDILAEEMLIEEKIQDQPSESATPVPDEDESTVGTGTSMALGCIAGTFVIILFGLLFLALRAFL